MAEPKVKAGERFAMEGICRQIASSIGGAIDVTSKEFGNRYGFALFVFTYAGAGEENWLTYISSAEREDVLKMIEEWVAQQRVGDRGTVMPAPGSRN